jgi:hypothetical protein
MNYQKKYLKYKNKYLELKQQYGNGLEGDTKKEYIRLLHQLYIKPYYYNNDDCYSNLLKHLLHIAYQESKKVFDTYIDKIPEPKKSNLIEQYKNVKSDTQKIISDDSHILDIPEFNVRSFQIIILYTELIKLTHTDASETSMLNYFQQPNYPIHTEYIKFLEVWYDYDKLYDIINDSNENGFKNLINPSTSFDKLMKRNKPDYTFRDIKQSRIVCYLDYITEKEFIFSFLNNIYYIGINEKLDYADGRLLTPFEFAHHDLTHAVNRGYYGSNIELEKKFYDYLEMNTELYTKEQKKQIYIIFFIAVHEGPEYLFENKIDDKLTFNKLQPEFVHNINNWKNKNFYNLLLPKNIQEETDENIQKYLDDSFELFKRIWNEFYDENTKSKINYGWAKLFKAPKTLVSS